MLEANDGSDERAEIGSCLLAHVESLLAVLRETLHNKSRHVSEFAHNDKEVLLDVLHKFGGCAVVSGIEEAEVGEVGEGLGAAAGNAAGDSHQVGNAFHHEAKVKFA